MEKVKIVSKVKHRVGIDFPDLRIAHIFPKEGASYSIDKEILEELLYDEGFRYMMENGILYIEDLEVKKELGLEPEDAKEPQNIIVLNDAQKKRYLTSMPIFDFKTEIKKLSYEQIQQLADYAVENKIIDIEKNTIIKEITGRDTIKAIQLLVESKED